MKGVIQYATGRERCKHTINQSINPIVCHVCLWVVARCAGRKVQKVGARGMS